MLKKILLKVAFFVAIIAAILLLAVGAVRFLPSAFSYVSTASASLFRTFRPGEALTVTSSKETIQSGDSIRLSWNNNPNSAENIITHACTKDIQVFYMGESRSKIPVPCGKTFRVGAKTFSAELTIVLPESNTFADIEFSIKQEQSIGNDRNGEKIITITSGTAPTTTLDDFVGDEPRLDISTTTTRTRPKSDTPSTDSGYYIPPQIYTGPADLIVTSITAGYLDTRTGLFIPSNSISASQYGAVQFIVMNQGGNPTGTWNLTATLPTQERLFESTNLSSLPSGSSAIFTLRLGQIVRSGRYSIVVVTDPQNRVSEQNENNNSAETVINVDGGISPSNSDDPDLIVRVLEVGFINSRGVLTQTPTDTVGVRFEVRNIGGETARNWGFRAELPTNDNEEIEEDDEDNLGPGDAIEYTLGFENPKDNGFIEIEADHEDNVDESNERNNTTRVRVTN